MGKQDVPVTPERRVMREVRSPLRNSHRDTVLET